MLTTILTVLMDIGLGAIAYRLAKSLETTQKQQTVLLGALIGRVDALEVRVRGQGGVL